MPAQDIYQRQKFNDPAQAAPRSQDRPLTRTPAAVLGGRPPTSAAKPFSTFVTLADFAGPQTTDPSVLVTPNYANPTAPYEGDQRGTDPPPTHFDLTTLLKRRF